MDADAAKDDVQWSQLPMDMVSKIQAQLPMTSLFRSQLVCTAWKKAFASTFLLQERRESGAGARDSMLFALGPSRHNADDGGQRISSCVYDATSDRWYRLRLRTPTCVRNRLDHLNTLGALLAGERLEGREFLQPVPCSVSAGGGVLMSICWDNGLRRQDHVRVVIPLLGNPVAGSWACLPAMPDNLGMEYLRGVFVDAMARCFKLVVVQNRRASALDVDPVSTFVFDSSLGCWNETTTELPRPSESFTRLSGQHGVFVGTVLYCSVGNHDLLTYDLEQARWSCLAVAKPYDFVISYVDLFSVRDRLLCLALGGDYSVQPRVMCMQIWELDFACMTWRVVGTMPDSMFVHIRWILAHEHIKVVAAAQDQVVYMALDPDLEKIVALDLKRTPPSWRWLPTCPRMGFNISLQCMDPWLQLGSWN